MKLLDSIHSSDKIIPEDEGQKIRKLLVLQLICFIVLVAAKLAN